MSENKCPECGCEMVIAQLYHDEPGYARSPTLHEIDGLQCLRNQLEQAEQGWLDEKIRASALQSIVDKLPVYEDTGEPFVPKLEPYYVVWFGKVIQGQNIQNVASIWCAGMHSSSPTKFYSTREAAEAAREGEAINHG